MRATKRCRPLKKNKKKKKPKQTSNQTGERQREKERALLKSMVKRSLHRSIYSEAIHVGTLNEGLRHGNVLVLPGLLVLKTIVQRWYPGTQKRPERGCAPASSRPWYHRSWQPERQSRCLTDIFTLQHPLPAKVGGTSGDTTSAIIVPTTSSEP